MESPVTVDKVSDRSEGRVTVGIWGRVLIRSVTVDTRSKNNHRGWALRIPPAVSAMDLEMINVGRRMAIRYAGS